ncbi:MAG: DMT family transporter [Candidatus Sericytochromatia bacterium]|nr:DMT family transporter [Candidatus Tanganyikabacteria bacterium]
MAPRILGLLLMAGAALSFAIMAAAGKHAGSALPMLAVAFWRSFGSFLLLLPLAATGAFRWQIQDKAGLGLRALSGTAAMGCYFWSLGRLPLAEALLWSHTSPVFTTLLAWWRLGERPGWRGVLGLLLASAGVLGVLRPDLGHVRPEALVGLLGGALAGLAYTQVRALKDEPTWGVVLGFMGLASLLLSPAVIVARDGWPDPSVLPWLAVAALAATLAQGLMTAGYALAPAGPASVAQTSAVLHAMWLGAIGFGEPPVPGRWPAALLLLAGIILAAWPTGEGGHQLWVRKS